MQLAIFKVGLHGMQVHLMDNEIMDGTLFESTLFMAEYLDNVTNSSFISHNKVINNRMYQE